MKSEEEPELHEESKEKSCWKRFWSPFRHICLVVGAFFFTATITVVVICGYQGLRVVFENEGVYHWLCPANYSSTTGQTIVKQVISASNGTDSGLCDEQIYTYGLFLSLASAILNIIIVLIGPMTDIIGPRIISFLGAALYTAGIFLLAFSSQAFDAYLVGYLLMAVGGICIFVCFIHINNILGMTMQFFFNAVLFGGQDASAGVGLLFQWLSTQFGVKLRDMLLVYFSLTVVFAIWAVIFQPWKPFQFKGGAVPPKANPKETCLDKIKKVRCCFRFCESCGNLWEKIKKIPVVSSLILYWVSYFKNVGIAVASLKFWIFLGYSSTITMCVYYYFLTFKEQFKWITDNDPSYDDTIETMIYVFGFLSLGIGYITNCIFAGVMSVFNTVGRKFEKVEDKWRSLKFLEYLSLPSGFIFIGCVALTMFICSLIKVLPLQYVTLACYLTFRINFFTMVMQFGVTFFPNIANSVIGVWTFLGGVLNLINYGLQKWARNRYFWFNLCIGVYICLYSVILAVCSVFWLRQRKKQQTSDDYVEINVREGEKETLLKKD